MANRKAAVRDDAPGLYELTVHGLTFPPGLAERRANFRLVVTVERRNDKGKLDRLTEVLPGEDSHWEYDRGAEKWSKFYVGPAASRRGRGKPAGYGTTDEDRFRQLPHAFKFDARGVYGGKMKLLDVDRRTFLDTLQAHIVELAGLAENLPLFGDTAGSFAKELLAGAFGEDGLQDNAIFTVAIPRLSRRKTTHTFEVPAGGYRGVYGITYSLSAVGA